jgi:hypothetical protein
MTSRSSSLLAITIATLSLFANTASADQIKDTLDREKLGCAGLKDKAKQELLDAFDTQIRIIRQTGDIDSVESLIAERKAFADAETLPDKPGLKAAVAKYQRVVAASDSVLKEAYETTIASYTKIGMDDDATLTKRLMNERFSPPTLVPQSASTATAIPAATPTDPILADLQQAKQEFIQTVKESQTTLLKAVQAKANAAADAGDLDGYKRYTDIYNVVGTELLLPDDVKDTTLRNENAVFLRAASKAYTKLHDAYQTAVSAYTKARKIPEAEAIQQEMKEGGWFAAYTGTPPVPKEIDMLKAINIQRDTLRPSWRFNGDALEPAGWNDDHGPFIRIPVSAKSSYELDVKFELGNTRDALYITIPVGKGWGLLTLASGAQYFGNAQGARHLPLNMPLDAKVKVNLVNSSTANLTLIVNDGESISWTGPNSDAMNGGDVWVLQDTSSFAVDMKAGKIIEMKLVASKP